MGKLEDVVSWESKALSESSEGRHAASIRAHMQALETAAQLERPRLAAVIYNRLGNALEADGRIQDAVVAYETGLKSLAGEAQSDLGQVIARLGGAAKGYDPGLDYLEAPDLYSETTADDLAEAQADTTLPVKLLINAGNAYLRQPQIDPALKNYEEALDRPEIAGAPVLRAHALTHVGIIRRRRGQIDEAEAALREALELLEEHGDPLEQRRALSTLASIYRERDEDGRALETYRQALKLYEQADDPLGEGRTLAGLGHLYLLEGKFQDARPVFQRAVDLAGRVGDQDTLWHAYWGLGRCQHEAGELDKAAKSFERCLNKIRWRRRELRTDEGKVTFLESVQDIYSHLIAVHLDRAQSDAAAYADALEVAEEARGQALHDLMGVRRRRFGSRQSGTRPTRTRPFADRLNMARQTAPGVSLAPSEAQPWAQMAPGVESAPSFDLAEQLALGQKLAAGTDVAAFFGDMAWDEDTGGMSDWIEAAAGVPSTVPRWPEEAGAPAPPGPDPEPLARLVFHVLPQRTAVLAVSPDGKVQGHVASVGQDALAERVAQVRQALRVDDAPRGVEVTRDTRRRRPPPAQIDHEPLLQALYTELIEPVAAALPSDGTPVVIEPQGALWLLPFAALLASDGTWLADRWPLLYSHSAQVLDEIRHEPDYGGPWELKPLIVGNPTMPTIPEREGVSIKLRPLPGAEQESAAIHNLFTQVPGTLMQGNLADWVSVLGQMPKHGIVHLATHGIAYAEDPLDSFIALGEPDEEALAALEEYQAQGAPTWVLNRFLAEFAPTQGRHGMLTAQQILYLPLPADLVTLSACQTGLGQISGEGMIGLSRSFLVAGARSVLVSQWSVSDTATARLMVAFYQYYIDLDDKAIALQMAMQALRADPDYAHPRYWAPFVVVGAEA